MSTSIVKSDGTVFTFDSTTRISFGPSIMITEHPIEDGSLISDHAQEMPQTIAVSGVISGAAPSSAAWDANNPNRQVSARDFLRGIIGETVSLVTVRFGTITSLMLTRYPYVIDGLDRTIFDIELKAVKIASAGSVFISPTAPSDTTASSLSSAQDAGEQPTTTPTDAEVEADETVLFSLFYGD